MSSRSVNKKIQNEDGSKDTILITGDDSIKVAISNNYTLANYKKKASTFTNKFKNSIFGSDIGVKSSGFSSITILATVIAVSVTLLLFLMWKY